MTERNRIFSISEEYLERKTRNIQWGAGLSLLLVAVVAFGRYRYPQTYNDVLLWSIVLFVIGANFINYLRHRRYLRLVRDHGLELLPGRYVVRGERPGYRDVRLELNVSVGSATPTLKVVCEEKI